MSNHHLLVRFVHRSEDPQSFDEGSGLGAKGNVLILVTVTVTVTFRAPLEPQISDSAAI
jgi:hypothetical protein